MIGWGEIILNIFYFLMYQKLYPYHLLMSCTHVCQLSKCSMSGEGGGGDVTFLPLYKQYISLLTFQVKWDLGLSRGLPWGSCK